MERNERLIAARQSRPSPRVPGRCLSRSELAEAVNAWMREHTPQPGALDAHYLGRLERGAVRWPGKDYRAAFRAVLGVASDDALGFRPPNRQGHALKTSELTRADPEGLIGAESSRRLAASSGAHSVDRAGLDALAAVLSSVRRLEDETSAADVLPSVLAQQTLIDRMAAGARSASRREAVGLSSEIAQYLGWLHIAEKNWAEARRNLDRAAVLGMEADDPVRVATALSFQAYRATLTGDLSQAAALSDAAARDGRIYPGLRTYLAFQRAEIAARSDQSTKAGRLLLEADRLVGNLPPAEELPEIGYWYQAPFFLGQRALVLHSLGDDSSARASAVECLAEIPAEWSGADWLDDIRALAD